MKPIYTIILSSVWACSPEKEPQTQPKQEDLSCVPNITIQPSIINFPPADIASDTPLSEIIVVSNGGGCRDLHIEDLYLEDQTSPFSLQSISSPLIPENGQAQFAVEFWPLQAGQYQNYVFVESDDPVTPIVSVQLNGRGEASGISVNPSEYDFGSLYVGCEETLDIQIENNGENPLLINDLETTSSSSEFHLDFQSQGAFPWILEPLETRELHLTYRPLDQNQDTAFITISSDDPVYPEIMLSQSGAGEILEESSQIFEPSANTAADIIFAFDRSGSIEDETIINMTDNLSVFTDTLKSLNTDFQIAATVGDEGCINPSSNLYIDNSYSNADIKTTFMQMIDLNHQIIPYGSNEERGLMRLETVLSQAVDSNGIPDPTGCNYGLIRENASLHLINVSDEPDQSPNSYVYYVSLFQSLKANPNNVVIHAISSDSLNGCGSTSPYMGGYQYVFATGGTFTSICSTDWVASFAALANAITPPTDVYSLDDIPVVETISVNVNGIDILAGWSYDAMDNRIVFAPDQAPVLGDTVQIDYVIQPSCGTN